MLKTSGGPPDAESADPLMKLFFVMSTIFKGVAKGGGQVGPAHPRIFLAHPRIKVKHLLKTRYICNNLKKKIKHESAEIE
jgi:hypothetical protein